MNINPPKVSNFTASKSAQSVMFELVLLLVMIGLVFYYLLSPKLHELGDRKAQYSKLQAENKKIEEQVRIFDGLVDKMKSEPEKISVLDEALPLDPKFSRLYILIESIVQSSGLSTSGINIDANASTVVSGDKKILKSKFGTDRKLITTQATVNAIGNLTQLENVLQQIESSGRLMDVNTLDITGGKSDQLLFKIGIKAYSFLPDQTSSKNASAAGTSPIKQP